MRLARSPFLVSLLIGTSDCMLSQYTSLNPAESLRYIYDEPGFREEVHSRQNSHSVVSHFVGMFQQCWTCSLSQVTGAIPVRFNLGGEIKDYITYAEFRDRVLQLVDYNPQRVWSNVDFLHLAPGGDEPLLVDMNDLAGVVNMRNFAVYYSQVENLAAIGALRNLEILRFEHVRGVQDMSGLRGLVNLRTLEISDTQVHGFGRIGRLERLDYLRLTRTGGIDMNDLRGFPDLTRLMLESITLQNVHALAKLANLLRLSLTLSAGDLNVSGLAGCRNLVDLTLEAANFLNLDALSRLQEVQGLSLRSPHGTINVSDIAGCRNPSDLNLEAAILQNVDSLAQMPNLQRLSLTSPHGAINVSDLSRCRNLSGLYLEAAHLQNIDAIARLANLESLSLTSPHGTINLSHLAGCRNLGGLYLEAAHLQNVHALAQLPNLETFKAISRHGAINLSDLTGCRNLTSLDLEAAHLQNFDALAQLPNLQLLFVNGQHVQDIPAFIQQPFIFPPAPVVPAHAEIATVFPADDRKCCICLNEVENLDDCLVTCGQRKAFHRHCLQQWCLHCEQADIPCPQCGQPLGLLP